MNKAEHLAIRYAGNAIDLREVNRKLKGLWEETYVSRHDGSAGYNLYELMANVRKRWLNAGDGQWPEAWPGSWVQVAEEAEEDDQNVFKYGRLLDQRKHLIAERGQIRRAIATHGRGLIRKARRAA